MKMLIDFVPIIIICGELNAHSKHQNCNKFSAKTSFIERALGSILRHERYIFNVMKRGLKEKDSS